MGRAEDGDGHGKERRRGRVKAGTYAILVTARVRGCGYGDPNVLYAPDVQVTNVDAPPPVIGRPMGDFDGNGSVDLRSSGPRAASGSCATSSPCSSATRRHPGAGDYNGDGTTDVAVFRPSTAQWFVRNQFTVVFGDPGDIPVPADYNGDGTTDVAVYRRS